MEEEVDSDLFRGKAFFTFIDFLAYWERKG
jgi:hypothetical protein